MQRLPEFEAYLDPSKLHYLHRLMLFVAHKWRRRGASAKRKTVFSVLEFFGRLFSELDLGRNRKLVSAAVRNEIGNSLQPGDVIVSRHRYALTNFFLPGVWPHASLYIGTEKQRKATGLTLEPALANRWTADKCTLEALKDGVRFRQLSETLRVDQFVVLRPRLTAAGIAAGIQRVVMHEGKGYNFDFDFFSSDQLVCTEVVYRAYDGIEGMRLPLVIRGGRQTITAEDLLDLSLDTDTFSAIAIFGFPKGCRDLIYGTGVQQALSESYRQ